MQAIICDRCGKLMKTKQDKEDCVEIRFYASNDEDIEYYSAQVCGDCAELLQKEVDGETHGDE